MKILLCADEKSANTLAWAKGFRELGAEVTIASVRAEKSSEGIIAIGNPLLPARLNFIFRSGKLRELISKIKPDILIGYRVTSYGYLCSCTGFHPLVLAAQNEQITYLPKPNPLRKKILEYFASKAVAKADLIHAWGKNMLPRLRELGADENKILVMHRGIDLDIFKPSLTKSVPNEPVFISTRSLFPGYRIPKILEAFRHVLEKYPNATLQIIGEGPERGKLINLANILGISSKTSFLGKLPPRDVAAKLQNSDIYVSTIETEGVSSSLLEACACGVYPIITDMIASRALIKDNHNGTLISPSIASIGLAYNMTTAFENIETRKKASRINTAMIADNYDFKKNTSKFLSIYKELIKCVEYPV